MSLIIVCQTLTYEITSDIMRSQLVSFRSLLGDRL